MASQIPNLPAGFKNNIPPQVYLPETVIQELPSNPEVSIAVDTISVFGQVFQRKYFYLFMIIAAGVIGYFLWKWYNDKKKGKNDEDSEEESGDEDDQMDEEQQALMEQMMMQEMAKHQLNKEN